MYAISLTAGQQADFLLLVSAAEIEAADILTRRRLKFADLDQILSARNFLPDRLVVVEIFSRLVDACDLHTFAEADRSRIRLFAARDHAKQRGLAGAVRTDDANDAASRQREIERVHQQLFTEAFPDVMCLDHDIAEPRAGRNVNLVGLVALLVSGRGNHLELLESRLGFCMPSFWIAADPLKFGLYRFASRLFR